MKIHEYQAKAILHQYGVSIPNGIACFRVDEAIQAAQKLGGERWVVKAQIYAGGRGKGGGVKLARSLDEVGVFAESMLNKPLINTANLADRHARLLGVLLLILGIILVLAVLRVTR